MPDDADELLSALQSLAGTQKTMLRRQLATEQVYSEIKRDIEDVRALANRVVENSAEIMLIQYKVQQLEKNIAQLYAIAQLTGTRLLLGLITMLIILLVLGIPIAILLFR